MYLSQLQFWYADKLTLAKKSKKKMSLKSFFEKRERSNDEIAENSKPTNKQKLHLEENTYVAGSWQQVVHILQAYFV